MKKLLLSVIALSAMAISTNAQIIVRGVSPAPIEGNKVFTWADNWGQTPDFNIPGTFVQDTVVFVEDGTPGTNPQGNPMSQEGCSPLTNGVDVAGKIAMIYRNTCEFGAKALNAQNAGAVGVIIVNRLPEAVGMGAGVDGPSVTIPVVMIIDADGAAIKAEMANGPVVMFLGNKQGILANDLVLANDKILRPVRSGVVSQLAQNATEFNFDVGARVFNYGFGNLTGVTLNAKVTDPASAVVYDNSVSGLTLAAGDSLDIDPTAANLLPQFSLATYPPGRYTLTYTVSSDSVEMDPADNTMSADFVVSDSLLTFSTIDNDNLPATPSGFRPGTTGNTFESCVFIQDANASRVGVEGVYFSFTSTATDNIDLTGEEISVNLYRWDDAFTDLDDATITFDQLVPVSSVQYYYPADLQDSTLLATFESPILLTDNDKYLACALTVNPLLFVGSDANSNYDYNISYYRQPITPNAVDGGYFPLGFGGDAISSIGAKIFSANELALTETESLFANVYPNPSSDKVYVTLNTDGAANVVITDILGKVVSSQSLNLSNGSGSLSVSDLADGAYIFNIIAANGASTKVNFIKK